MTHREIAERIVAAHHPVGQPSLCGDAGCGSCATCDARMVDLIVAALAALMDARLTTADESKAPGSATESSSSLRSPQASERTKDLTRSHDSQYGAPLNTRGPEEKA